MAQNRLTTLKKHRKLAALTQDELAYLLGCVCGSKLSRYERQGRLPTLETVLALELILNMPVHDLFPGIYDDIAPDVINRARHMLKTLHEEGCCDTRKLRCLKRIAYFS